MKFLWAFINICILIILSTAAATAAMCAPREVIVKALDEKYHEASTGKGIASGGQVIIEFFTSANGETYTILSSTPNGLSCILAAGTNWIDVKPEKAGMKS